MNAAIDIGNTKTKLGIFNGAKLFSLKTFDAIQNLGEELAGMTLEAAIVSSVKLSDAEIKEKLELPLGTIFLGMETPLPFQNNYQSNTLGLDRIAAMAGAQVLYPNEHVLVIDAGTCITYEVLEAGKIYHGGAISPGMQMRFKSMHNFTARLPLVKPEPIDSWVGNTTEKAMLSGVVHGIIAEMQAYILEIESKYSPLTVIITGGDAKFFESKIKPTIFAIPELVLLGLNAILRHNASI